MKTDRELLECLVRSSESIDARLARMEAVHADLLIAKPTQKELAKRMGVHPTTLWRRRDRARIKRLLEPLERMAT